MLLLVHKILKFYINGMLNCKCPAPGSKGYYALKKFLMSFQSVVAFIKEIIMMIMLLMIFMTAITIVIVRR